MKNMSVTLGVAILAAALMGPVAAQAAEETRKAVQAPNLSGLHDFDFLRGNWKAHHRRLKERFVSQSEWVEFDGTVSQRPLMDGWGNTGDNLINLPGGAYRGVSLRSYDSKTGLWTVWWLDGRSPADDLDPPIKGHFENGVGHFYANDTVDGKPIRVRVTWTRPTPTTARWEQAYSADAGKTWEINWITDFTKVN
jgi:hypothetical protein